MSPLDPWRCNPSGTRYVSMRDGSQSALFTPEFAYTPKATVQAGLVSVDPTKLPNYGQYGPDSYVYKVPWGTVEPSSGTYSWTAIDNMLSTYNPARMTLRIQAGGSAPGWLKTATGSITITNAQGGLSTVIAHFWETVALDAWDAMIRAAGARYDNDPRVVLVSSDEAMTLYSEPLILGGDTSSAIAMHSAGLDAASHANAMHVSTQSTCEAFPSTMVEFAGHADWQQATASGVRYSWPDGRAFLLELCQQWKGQLVISDYGLDSTDYASNFAPTGTLSNESNYYKWMRNRVGSSPSVGGGPIGFQLTLGVGESHTGAEYADAAQNAYDFGANYVETAGWGSISPSTLITSLDAQLKVQAGY